MENVITMNGFMELNQNECMEVDGGFNGQEFAFGFIAFGAVLTAGVGLVAAGPAIIALGAIYAGAVVGGSCIGAVGSGYLLGDSFMHR